MFSARPTFNSGAITAFGALMAAAKTNGWIVLVTTYPSANWATLATTSPGAYAPSPGGLFGGRGAGLFG